MTYGSFGYKERIQLITDPQKILANDLWIDYPVAVECIELLRLLFSQPTRCDRSYDFIATTKDSKNTQLIHRYQGMMLIGKTGNGKTEILRKFRKIAHSMAGGEMHMPGTKEKVSLNPVVLVNTPPMKIKFLFKKILEKIKYPISNTISKDDLLEQVIAGLKTSQVQMLMLDEFQNILRGDRSNLELLMSMLVHISSEAKLSLVLAGTPEIDTAVSSYPPLITRLLPFDLPRWKNGEIFQSLLKTMAEKRGLSFYPPLESEIINNHVYYMTEGYIGEVANLLYLAQKRNGYQLRTPNCFENIGWVRPSQRRSRLNQEY